MYTPIIKISEDQNEITHESGVVTVFQENDTCENCCYDLGYDCAFPLLKCCDYERIDKRNGIFKLKP